MNLKLLISTIALSLPQSNATADIPNHFKHLIQQTCVIIATARSTWQEVKRWVPIYHIVFEDSDGQRTKLIKKHGLLTLEEQATKGIIFRQPFDSHWPLATKRIFFSPNHEFHNHNEKYKNRLSCQKCTVVATLVNPETTRVHADIFMAAFNLDRYEKTRTLYKEWEKNEQKYKHMYQHLDKERFEIVRNVENGGEPILIPKNTPYSYHYRSNHNVEISLERGINPKYLSIFPLTKELCQKQYNEQREAQINKIIGRLRLRTWAHETLKRLNITTPFASKS